MPKMTNADHARDLNRINGSTKRAKLGQVVADLVAQQNALLTDLAAARAKINSLLAKLDADAGVTDTNYAATQAVPALTATPVADFASR